MGLTAAIYAARGGLDPLVITGSEPGGKPAIATDIDDYPGFPDGVKGPELVSLFRKQADRFKTQFLEGKVIDVDFSKKPFEIKTENETLFCQSAILAVGSAPLWLNVPGEQSLIGRGVSVCSTCDGPFFKGKSVAVVGGGDSAMKEAIYLAKLASDVTIIHRRDIFRAQEALREQVKKLTNVKSLMNSEVIEVLGEGKVTGLKIKNNQSGQTSRISLDGLFLAIGWKPDTEFLKGKIELTEDGHIVLKGESETSVPGVFSGGDAADKKYRQIVTACAFGCKAALDAEKFLDNQV
ncbi:MAG: Thioredoxin reductase [Candidatus Daviesbacteria bacterium GW2011_GWB1_41_5]|nr:MAG: Thioredoxin reductase [Candidatus Daviesbacteria bacterium GW2011_GWB1_41_5]